MMKKNYKDTSFAVIGFVLAAAGLYFVKALSQPQGFIRALPYICIGLGCGLFGHGIGNIISYRVIKNNPDIVKQIKIEKTDERNIAISDKAKAKAYDLMIYVFGALMLSFALMGIDLAAVLLLVASYLAVVFYGIYYRTKYDKEM
jgi:uncharacterized membrane protein